MATRLNREQLRKKAPRLVALIIAIALAALILLEVMQRYFVDSTPLSGDFLVASIVYVTRNVTSVMATFGYGGIFLLMLLDASSFPIPSEMILPFAGYLVFRGDLEFFAVASVATVASIGGSLVDYYIGMKGAHILREHKIIGRVLFSEKQLNTAVYWFNRYGAIMVVVSRLIPIFRTLISFPAGAVRMPLKKFIAYTALGCLVWNSLLTYIGYYLGTKWTQVVGVLNHLVIVVIVASIGIFIGYLFLRKQRTTSSNNVPATNIT